MFDRIKANCGENATPLSEVVLTVVMMMVRAVMAVMMMMVRAVMAAT